MTLQSTSDYFKENSDLPSDVGSSQVFCNSLFIHGLNWDLSSKLDHDEMGTVPTSDLVNLANQASHTLGESPKRAALKFLIFISSK